VKNIFKNKTILITGGTGSFGKNFILRLQKNYQNIKKVIIYSRDELKQHEFSQVLKPSFKKKTRFLLGDVRDFRRFSWAVKDVDIVLHAAALKQVPAAEYDPFEFIKTNIVGAQNIIEACLNSKVQKVIALSTDKAASPINLYGATKLCSDKLFSSANNVVGKKKIKFSIIRYGNVMNSRGSVIPFFKNLETDFFPITSKNMTRFNITIDQAIDMVLWVINKCRGGEIFVPKLHSYKIQDLTKAIDPNKKIKIIGLRPGEKMHEEMISSSDSYNTVDLGKYYAILNPLNKKVFSSYKKYKRMKPGLNYNSKDNKFLKIKDIKNLLKKNK
tara:strand:- start:1251 stop:2237 length:987 start_codon:yes stop_codon:yes gene_type:complete